MNIKESTELIRDILIAEKDPKTPVGAAKSLRDRFNNKFVVATGVFNNKFVLHTNAPENKNLKIWNGFEVIYD